MKMKYQVLGLFALGILFTGITGTSNASGTGTSSNWTSEEQQAAPPVSNSMYDKGVMEDQVGNDKAAYEYFKKALASDKNNPDILNMLAHSERKLGMINEAIDDYWKALKLRPRFPEAREYMGEAYIQATLKEIETLKSYGPDGEKQRRELIKAFKDAADGLEE